MGVATLNNTVNRLNFAMNGLGSGRSPFALASFQANFDDAGAGVVGTTLSRGGQVGTFTRATTATTIGSTGLVIASGSGSPRSYYDPTSLTYLGYLSEGARTNLLLRSEDITDAAWTKVDSTPTKSGTGPDGGANTANLITEGSAGTARVTQSVTGTADANYAVSRFFKRGNTDFVALNMGSGANEVTGWFNLNTGVVGSITAGGTGVAGVISIKAYPSSWYLCAITGSVGSGATAIAVNTLSANANASTTRVANSTRSEWGTQFENNVSFASSYIPTVGATVTRNADVLTYPTTGWFNAANGTIFADYTPGVSDASAHQAFSLNDGTANEVIYLGNVSSSRFVVIDGGALQVNISGTSITVGTRFKEAASYALNDFAISKDGGAVATDSTGTLPTVNVCSIGVGEAGSASLFGTIRRVAYWPQRLGNGVLQSLTI